MASASHSAARTNLGFAVPVPQAAHGRGAHEIGRVQLLKDAQRDVTWKDVAPDVAFPFRIAPLPLRVDQLFGVFEKGQNATVTVERRNGRLQGLGKDASDLGGSGEGCAWRRGTLAPGRGGAASGPVSRLVRPTR